MNYFWSKYDLEERIKLLEKIKREKSPIEQEEIDSFIYLINKDINYLKGIHKEPLPYLIKVKKDIIKKGTISEIVSDIENFSELDIDIGNHEIPNNFLFFTDEDILDITNDFYKNQNKSIYRKFLEFYNERRNHLVFVEGFHPESNITFFIPYFNEIFMSINKTNTLSTLYSSIHEFAHAISFKYNSEVTLYDKNKQLFLEIETLFFELVASDYFTTNINTKDEYHEIIQNHYLFLHESKIFDDRMKIANLVMQSDIKTNEEFRKICNEELHFTNDYLDNIMKQNTLEILKYLTSYLFAIELYELYKKDKEKALHILEKIMLMKNNSTLKYYNNIKELGLNPNSHTTNFLMDLDNKSRCRTIQQ